MDTRKKITAAGYRNPGLLYPMVKFLRVKKRLLHAGTGIQTEARLKAKWSLMNKNSCPERIEYKAGLYNNIITRSHNIIFTITFWNLSLRITRKRFCVRKTTSIIGWAYAPIRCNATYREK